VIPPGLSGQIKDRGRREKPAGSSLSVTFGAGTIDMLNEGKKPEGTGRKKETKQQGLWNRRRKARKYEY